MKPVPIINTPCIEELEFYQREWDKQENYVLQEHALDKLFFNVYPNNTDINDILIKASSLNDFYSTNIFSIFSVAKHILSLNIDERLKKGDLTLVRDIANISIKGVDKCFYSFATKYCSHHQPLFYPIYDRYVDKILCHFKKKDSFSDFNSADLKDYASFNRVLEEFQAYYGLEGYNKKELDKYLWQLGKKHYPNSY